jgi:hypothetical protein
MPLTQNNYNKSFTKTFANVNAAYMEQLHPRFHKKLCQCKCHLHGGTTTTMFLQKSFASVNVAYMEQLQPWLYKKAYMGLHGTTTMTVSLTKLCQCKCRLHGTTISTVSQKSFANVNATYMEKLQ